MKKSSLKAVLNMSGLSMSAKINRARVIVQAIDSHPNTFQSPNPDLNTVKQAIDALETAFSEASDGGKTRTKLMYNKEDELTVLMNALAAYVQLIADGDESIVFLAAMNVKTIFRPGARTFSVEQGKDSGEVIIKTPTVKGAVYFWEYIPDPVKADGWISAGNSVLSSMTVKGLTPGIRYWFRVYYIDREGKHPYNEPISLIVV